MVCVVGSVRVHGQGKCADSAKEDCLVQLLALENPPEALPLALNIVRPLRLLHGRRRRVLVLEEGAHQQRVLEAARADVSSACKLSHAVICVAAERSQVKSGQDRVC